MSTIDPSTILTTQPPALAPTTAGVRGVFAAVKGQITAAKADIEALEADVTDAQYDITTLEGQMSSAQGDISTLQSDTSTLQSDVADLDYRVTTLEGGGGGGGEQALKWLLIASSAVIGDNSAAELAYSKSVTIPAGTLQAGDLLRVRAHGICTANPGFASLKVRIRFGGIAGVVLADSGDTWSPSPDDDYILTSDMTIRSTTEGWNFCTFPTQAFALFDAHGTKVIDTTIANELVVTAEWLAATVGQGSRLDVLEVFISSAETQVS